ncbi:MAG: HipA domain-containing protein [Eubacterium sp.]|nr:HipA domain-containing protein [Eubacterium sp.]
MKDFSNWREYEGASEGSGRSEKQWLINPETMEIGLFKYKKDEETTDHASECIASDLAELIGLSCARFELGRYYGREGSFSYNIVEKDSMELVEGVHFISSLYSKFDVEKLMDTQTGEKYSLEMIASALKGFHLFEEFLPILVFDFLIGNTDRHQSNWAFIKEENKYRLSPLYDNSSSLCAFVSESKIKKYLGRDKMLWKSLTDSKSKSLIRIFASDKNRPTHTDVVKYLNRNYCRQTQNIVNQINKFVTKDEICDILKKYEEVLSEERQLLITKYILTKKEILMDIYQRKE